jgi:hypothetical protein
MVFVDRRARLTIEQVNVYWRHLKDGTERPDLHKLCNAIRTLDLALAESETSLCRRLSTREWSHIRNDCFAFLISSFTGYFLVYSHDGVAPEPGCDWPESGRLEFYPQEGKRRDDSYQAYLADIDPSLILRLRWCAAEGRHHTAPQDFSSYREAQMSRCDSEEAEEARVFLDRLFETCADEASKLKKIAHRKWWQLHYEVSSCADRRLRNDLKKQMQHLELIWGPSSSTVSH